VCLSTAVLFLDPDRVMARPNACFAKCDSPTFGQDEPAKLVRPDLFKVILSHSMADEIDNSIDSTTARASASLMNTGRYLTGLPEIRRKRKLVDRLQLAGKTQTQKENEVLRGFKTEWRR
jgi:hypothetical protein